MTQEHLEPLVSLWIISRDGNYLYEVEEYTVTQHSHQDAGPRRHLGQFPTLKEARKVIPPYAVHMPRDQQDRPEIVESWM
jgi:hypothetical protein